MVLWVLVLLSRQVVLGVQEFPDLWVLGRLDHQVVLGRQENQCYQQVPVVQYLLLFLAVQLDLDFHQDHLVLEALEFLWRLGVHNQYHLVILCPLGVQWVQLINLLDQWGLYLHQDQPLHMDQSAQLVQYLSRTLRSSRSLRSSWS